MRDDWDRFFNERYLTRWFGRDDPEITEREAVNAVALAGVHIGADVLDAGCGFGRHARVLARLGYRTTGVDRSAPLVARARRLSQCVVDGLVLLVADYVQLPFPDRCFDAVISMNSSLGFDSGADDDRALREFARVLRVGGTCVIETNHKKRADRGVPERAEEPFGEDGSILIIEREYDPVTGILTVEHTVRSPTGQTDTLKMSRRLYEPPELEQMLHRAGFAATTRYGDLDGGAFSDDSRLIIVAQT